MLLSLLRRSGLVVLGAVALLPTLPAAAQSSDPLNWQASPINGTVQLTHGFSPDPTTRNVNAGGSRHNPVSGSGCSGYLNANGPTLNVGYVPGSASLTISAASPSDVSLVVHTPDGRWLCDDDSGSGSNAKLTVSTPGEGIYSIWVATFSSSPRNPSTTVGFSERGREASFQASTASGTTDPLNWQVSPAYGTVQLSHGFSPDPTMHNLNAGGATRNPVQGSGCTGYLNANAPTLNLAYTPGSFNLTISAAAQTDVSLVVHTPDGRWLCDDDSGSGNSAKLVVRSPSQGVYSIWVATYSSSSSNPGATVGFSEIGNEATVQAASSAATGAGNPLNWQSTPTYGTVQLTHGFSPDPTTQKVSAGGATRNPVSGSGCRGYLDVSAPTLNLGYVPGASALTISAASSADVSIVVHTPDGRWLCDDDSGAGSSAMLTIRNLVEGIYSIWVGTASASRSNAPAATVGFSEQGRQAQASGQ